MKKLTVVFRYFANAPKKNRNVKAFPYVMFWTYASEAEQRELHFE